MAQDKEKAVDLNESSVHQANRDSAAAARGDVATEADLDRLETMTGGADEPPAVDRTLAQQLSELEASTEEEVDALRVNLLQDSPIDNTRDGSGRIVDDVAEEHIAGMTEVGPGLIDKGVVSAVPGRDDTSDVLRRHHPNTETARSQDVVEGNLDEPKDEVLIDRKVDEGTAA